MNNKFETLFEETLKLFEMDYASVLGDSPYSGDYTIAYAPGDARNVTGEIPKPHRKKKKGKKSKSKVIMPIQRRRLAEGFSSGRKKYDIFIKKYHDSEPRKVDTINAHSEKQARVYFTKTHNLGDYFHLFAKEHIEPVKPDMWYNED